MPEFILSPERDVRAKLGLTILLNCQDCPSDELLGDETKTSCGLSFDMQSCLIPTDELEPSTGPSIENPATHLDHDFDFDFQIVVFKVYISFSPHEEPITFFFPKKVENTLFKILRNGFNLPGTPFEAMFALPQAINDSDASNIEGSSLENLIHLPGVKVDLLAHLISVVSLVL